MLRHGASLTEIGEVLGHRSPETTKIYYAQTVDMCSEAAEVRNYSAMRSGLTQHNIWSQLAERGSGLACARVLLRVTTNGASQEGPCSAARMEAFGQGKAR